MVLEDQDIALLDSISVRSTNESLSRNLEPEIQTTTSRLPQEVEISEMDNLGTSETTTSYNPLNLVTHLPKFGHLPFLVGYSDSVATSPEMNHYFSTILPWSQARAFKRVVSDWANEHGIPLKDSWGTLDWTIPPVILDPDPTFDKELRTTFPIILSPERVESLRQWITTHSAEFISTYQATPRKRRIMGIGTLPCPEVEQMESIFFQVRNDVFPEDIQVQDIDWLHPVGFPESPNAQLFYRTRTVSMPWVYEPIPPEDNNKESSLLSIEELKEALTGTLKSHHLMANHIPIFRKLLQHFKCNLSVESEGWILFYDILRLLVDIQGTDAWDITFPPTFEMILFQLNCYIMNSAWQLKSPTGTLAPTLELLQVLL